MNHDYEQMAKDFEAAAELVARVDWMYCCVALSQVLCVTYVELSAVRPDHWEVLVRHKPEDRLNNHAWFGSGNPEAPDYATNRAKRILVLAECAEYCRSKL